VLQPHMHASDQPAARYLPRLPFVQASLDEKRDGAQALGPSPLAAPGTGPPSFAQLARMGFAATGPALGSSPPSGVALQTQVRRAGVPRAVWAVPRARREKHRPVALVVG